MLVWALALLWGCGEDAAKGVEPALSGDRASSAAWLDGALDVLAREYSESSLKARDIDRATLAVLTLEGHELRLLDPALVAELRARHAPIFVEAGGLTPAGDALLEALLGLRRHGLQPSSFQVVRLRDELDRLNGDVVRPVELGLSAEARLELVDKITRVGSPPPQELARRMVTPGTPLFEPDLESAVGRLASLRERRLWRLARIEVLMTDAWVRYALEMQVARRCGIGGLLPWSLPDAEPVGPAMRAWADLLGAERADLCVRVRMEVLTGELERRGVASGGAQEVLAGLAPDSTDYAALGASLRGLAERSRLGGWGVLPFVEAGFVSGEGGEAVLALRGRLVQEGLLESAAGVWDSEAAEAVARARVRYGLERVGGVDAALVKRLNTPLGVRAWQVRVNLQRWRLLPVERNPSYALLNVASGMGEVVSSGRRVFQVQALWPTRPEPGLRALWLDAVAVEGTGVVALRGADGRVVRLSPPGVSCGVCLRSDRPLELAQRLLQLTGRGGVDLGRAARQGSTLVPLNPQFPLYIIALTVTAETDGTLRFHDDFERAWPRARRFSRRG